MRPTRRGYAALAVVAVAMVLAWSAGPRSLNAVAAPLLVAVVAGAVQVSRAGRPTVERSSPRRGFPGETRTVELRVEGGGVARIEEDLPPGLDGDVDVERTLPTTVRYEVEYARRGVHGFGTTDVRVRDVLGLVETTYRVRDHTEALVFPRVYSVGDPSAVLGTAGPESDERTEFDRIREYVPGDSLRDVNWKASAKYDDLLVTEFADPTDDEAVAIAASCGRGHADEMATAAATVLVAAVRAGLSVELTVPGGRVARGYGETHRKRALELLARTGGGTVSEGAWEAADVKVRADDGGVAVAVADRVHDLEDVTASRENPLVRGVVA